jgi:hypothetical protein
LLVAEEQTTRFALFPSTTAKNSLGYIGPGITQEPSPRVQVEATNSALGTLCPELTRQTVTWRWERHALALPETWPLMPSGPTDRTVIWELAWLFFFVFFAPASAATVSPTTTVSAKHKTTNLPIERITIPLPAAPQTKRAAAPV